ncbi:MAG TPA: c-type cytochrome [Blastocatellia bacterium]|nr:c-type cytochrome [Blastocatellia bacterium]
MADKTQSEQLEKRAPDVAEPDPIADRSMSVPLLISSLLLILTMIWSLYDEVRGQRPWKQYQRDFVSLYSDYLGKQVKDEQKSDEQRVKDLPEYRELSRKASETEEAVAPRVKEILTRTSQIDQQIADITPPFQDARSWLAAKTYQLETTESEGGKNSLRNAIAKKKAEKIDFKIHNDDGRLEEKELTFTELEELYNKLVSEKARRTADFIKLNQPIVEARKKRDDFLQNKLNGLSVQQVQGLQKKMDDFKYEIKQLNVGGGQVIDRCESCHLGTREPLTITKTDLMWEDPSEDEEKMAAAFVSHPSKDLLKVHDPERFGCSTCHGGNGRGTTSVEKAHGRYEHWLWPLYYKENMQAGCVQCHSRDRVLQGADTLNRGRQLFQVRGCVGCHRYEGYDRELDSLSNARQSIKTLELEKVERQREIDQLSQGKGEIADPVEQKRRGVALRQMIAQLDARIDEFDIQSRYLMQDQKKVGPNLKEIRAKLNRDWLPVWLSDPQAFRPGTKMPTFRLNDDEVKAISAFLWQNALEVKLPQQQPGDANHGKELFKTIGCMGCHSINGKAIDMDEGRIGGDFAADLSRVGEKASYEYIVRWIHNPRQRLAPYSPSEKKDLLPADYRAKGLPFVFDDEHTKSPNNGRELQIQNMTVMPNFRLSEQDARDIASFLMNQKRMDPQYPDGSYMDNKGDAALVTQGETLVRRYGCGGCHEIKGMEDEQRIGTELTVEGSKPIERLDFALLQHDAEANHDPFSGKEIEREDREGWYDHKGFFEYKLRSPGIYDRGKEKAADEKLRMPNIYLPESDVTALTTFLLGSVETNLPVSMRYTAEGQKKAAQDGWWVVQKYNCMGCHNVLIGQDSVLMGLPMYQGDAQEQLPPRLTSEGARVKPDWLMSFLKDPSLTKPNERASLGKDAGQVKQALMAHLQGATAQPAQQSGQAQNQQAQNGISAVAPGPEAADWAPSFRLSPAWGMNRNGVRGYLKVRMPTFHFSPNELQALVNFFMAASDQHQPYIPEQLDPITTEEQTLARALFTSKQASCLQCHMTGDPAHDVKATAPNFLLAPERLKPLWTKRWIYDPQVISPGVNMPSELFIKDPNHDRLIFKAETPPAFQNYDKDHLDLIVRYLFEITPDEQRRIGGGGGAQPTAPTQSAATTTKTTATGGAKGGGTTGAGRAP